MALDLSSLRKALASLESSLNVACYKKMAALDKEQRETIRAGVIQNFEFTYELCWKFIKRWLDNNYVNGYSDGITRKELFRIAAENRLIRSAKRWMEYHEARNETSHTYNEAIAREVFAVAVKFLPEAKGLLKALEEKND